MSMEYTDYSNDKAAMLVFDQMKEELRPILARLMPGSELKRMGVKRGTDWINERGEILVELRLHIAQKVPSDGDLLLPPGKTPVK